MSGAEMRRLRKAAGMTQSELGSMIGRHWVVISRYENGHIPIPKSIALAMTTIGGK